MLSCHIDPFLAFTKDLQMYGCEVHLYRGANTFGMILDGKMLPQEVSWWDTENIYFLAGVRKGMTKRAADADVLWRGMFTLDFDIRKEMEKAELPTSDGPIEVVTEKILSSIEHHPIFGQFRYAVLSGNGLHVHYFGLPVEVEKEKWSAGMKNVFEEVNAVTPIPCDTGCGNAGRIMRMPGSWNVKDPMKKKPVNFLVWNTGVSIQDLKFIQERGTLALSRQEEKKAAEKADFAAQHPEGPSDVISLINSIPIEQVVEQLPMGCKLKCVKKDGGMRFVDDKGTERGFFKHKEFNIIVHEGTSLFPPPTGKGYNCLGLTKLILQVETPAAIEWFAGRSTPVRDARARGKEEWVKENASKDVEFFEKSLSTLSRV